MNQKKEGLVTEPVVQVTEVLCTLANPASGSARVAGHDVVKQRDTVRRNSGLVFQDTTLDSYLTGEQNLRFHADLYGVLRAQLGADEAGPRHGEPVRPSRVRGRAPTRAA